MESSRPDADSSEFEIPGALRFERGSGGFEFAQITTPAASASICLHGGHVTDYTPAGEPPLLWLSPEAVFRSDKAIRGGVPVCWPWFSAHPTDPTQPSHGHARLSLWQVVASAMPDPGTVELTMELPGEIGCRLVVSVGAKLSLALTTTNSRDETLELTQALHSYLRVGDIERVHCEGLDGVRYIDSLDGDREKVQQGPVRFGAELDRIYTQTAGDVLVHDPALGRTLRVAKWGSRSTVVWNPWSNRAAEIGDMPDDGYRTMLCVEAANVGADAQRLRPGEVVTLGTSIEQLPAKSPLG